MKTFNELRKINVNDHTEKKGRFTYLSWTWAVDQLLENDPSATWTFGEPTYFAESLMVYCTVTAFGKSMTCQMPVINNQNKAIPNPKRNGCEYSYATLSGKNYSTLWNWLIHLCWRRFTD